MIALMPQNWENAISITASNRGRRYAEVNNSVKRPSSALDAALMAANSVSACVAPPTRARNITSLILAAFLSQPARAFRHGEKQPNKNDCRDDFHAQHPT